MADYSIVANGKVINRIGADQAFVEQLVNNNPSWSVHLDGGNIGDDWDGSVFTPQPPVPVVIPAPKTKLTHLEFFERFTDQEFIDIYASNSGIVKMLVKKLEMSQEIDLEDQRVIDGVGFMSTPQGGSILAPERVPEILTP